MNNYNSNYKDPNIGQLYNTMYQNEPNTYINNINNNLLINSMYLKNPDNNFNFTTRENLYNVSQQPQYNNCNTLQNSPYKINSYNLINSETNREIERQKLKFDEMIEQAKNINSTEFNIDNFDLRKYLPKEDIFENSKTLRKYKDLLKPNNKNKLKQNKDNEVNFLENKDISISEIMPNKEENIFDDNEEIDFNIKEKNKFLIEKREQFYIGNDDNNKININNNECVKPFFEMYYEKKVDVENENVINEEVNDLSEKLNEIEKLNMELDMNYKQNKKKGIDIEKIRNCQWYCLDYKEEDDKDINKIINEFFNNDKI